MTGTTHITAGTVLGISGYYFLYSHSVEGALFFGGCVLGSILPDIDSHSSKISYKVPLVSFLVRLICGHRGSLHTPLAIIVLAFIMSILVGLGVAGSFCIGLTTGYLLHLVQDTFTKQGIMWGWPFSKKRFSILGIKVGRSLFVEYTISGCILIPIIVVMLLVWKVK